VWYVAEWVPGLIGTVSCDLQKRVRDGTAWMSCFDHSSAETTELISPCDVTVSCEVDQTEVMILALLAPISVLFISRCAS
jgi:hypothetical protein